MLKKRSLISTFAVSLLLSACAHSPQENTATVTEGIPVEVAVELPQEYSASNDLSDTSSLPLLTAETEAQIIASIQTLAKQFSSEAQTQRDLESLIELGLENNPNLAATASRVLDAELTTGITRSSLYPDLTLGGNAGRAKSNALGQSFISDNYALNLNSRWELDLWGRLRDQNRADVRTLQAIEFDVRFAELALAANITRAYFNLITEKEVLKLSASSKANTQRIEKITERSFKRGLVSALDVQLARRDLATTESLEIGQANTVTNASRSLSVLLGEYPEHNKYVQTFNTTNLPAELRPLRTGIPASILQKRPDLLANMKRIEAAEFDISAARKALYPSIALTGSGGSSSSELSDLLDSNFSVWSLFSNLSMPLLNRTRLVNSKKLAENALARELDSFNADLLAALQEVENGISAEQSLRQQMQKLQEARDYAEQSARRAQTQYESGLVDASTLLATQNQFFRAEETLLRTRNALLQNRIGLYLALGGNPQDTNKDVAN